MDTRSLTKRVDGLLALNVPLADKSMVSLRDLRVPVVTVGTAVEGMSGVLVDNVEVGRQATQHLLDLQPRVWTSALVLSPQGHVEHAFSGYDDGEALLVHTEPGASAALVEFLERMKFMMRAEITDVTAISESVTIGVAVVPRLTAK